MAEEPNKLPDDAPDGCLECNHAAVHAWLVQNGLDPARFVRCPPTRHAWSDIIRCTQCGSFHLVKPAPDASGKRET